MTHPAPAQILVIQGLITIGVPFINERYGGQTQIAVYEKQAESTWFSAARYDAELRAIEPSFLSGPDHVSIKHQTQMGLRSLKLNLCGAPRPGTRHDLVLDPYKIVVTKNLLGIFLGRDDTPDYPRLSDIAECYRYAGTARTDIPTLVLAEQLDNRRPHSDHAKFARLHALDAEIKLLTRFLVGDDSMELPVHLHHIV